MLLPRVLLADDHAIVAEGLRLLLKDHCELVGSVADGPSLVAAAEALRPDVIVADISMPGFDGLEAVRRIRARGIPSKVVMLTMYADPDVAQEALAIGANGYVIKTSAGEELLRAIRDVLDGGTYVTPLAFRDRKRRGPI
jgi:DNA-binding NarL/FixJ family response regulator